MGLDRCAKCGEQATAGARKCPSCGALAPHHGMLTYAKRFADAARRIEPHRVSTPYYYLCGHAIEVALKSVLLRNGWSHNDLKTIGHDLCSALEKVSNLSEVGLLPSGLCDGVTTLQPYYKDHHFRYFTKTGVMTLPDPKQLMEAVTELVDALRDEYDRELRGS